MRKIITYPVDTVMICHCLDMIVNQFRHLQPISLMRQHVWHNKQHSSNNGYQEHTLVYEHGHNSLLKKACYSASWRLDTHKYKGSSQYSRMTLPTVESYETCTVEKKEPADSCHRTQALSLVFHFHFFVPSGEREKKAYIYPPEVNM
jgi:hypothetical protein